MAEPVDVFADAFEREKAAFMQRRPFLRHLAGQFVAVHNGEIVASDKSRNGVLRQFFAEHAAGASVYVGFVGSTPVARVRAPMFVRCPTA